MNVVDYVIIGIVGISLLFGFYRGFVTSLLGLLGIFLSMFAAYAIGPTLAAAICRNETVVQTLIHYTDAASRLGDLDLSGMSVAGLSAGTINEIVSRVQLPMPFDSLLRANMVQQVFASIGSVNVSEYINQTIVTAIVSILSYIVVFIIAYVALSLITRLIGHVFKFPSLKHLDTLLGGLLGIVRGVFIVYVLFALAPILMTVLPIDDLGEWIQSSQLGNALYHSNIVTTILQGHL